MTNLILTDQEETRLSTLETMIERGFKSFAESGKALAVVRDEKLYRASYKTFEEYCQDRWGINRRYADRLIESAEVVNKLVDKIRPMGLKIEDEGAAVEESGRLLLPITERQIRELAKAPEEEQAEVWQEVIATTAVPTAAAVKAVVEERKAKKDDTVSTSPTKPSASIVRDALKREIPGALREKYAMAARLGVAAKSPDGRYADLLAIVDRYAKRFIEDGNALAEIKRDRLYRETHSSFEAYCKDHWDIGSNYARRLITSTEVVNRIVDKAVPIGTLTVLPTTESQTRELAKAPESEQAEVWAKVVEVADTPTAKIVRSIVKQWNKLKEAVAPKPAETVASEPKADTVSECSEGIGLIGAAGVIEAGHKA